MSRNAFWIGSVAALASTAIAHDASAEGIARGALKDTMFPYICTDSATARPETIVFMKRTNGEGYLLFPHLATATLNGTVFTATTERETFSMNGSRFVSVTDDAVRSGECVSIAESLDHMIGMIEDTSPEAFDKLAADFMAPWAEKRAQLEADTVVAKAAAEAEAAARAASTLGPENDRLRRENDKLKARICLMDPDATFSICPEARAKAKP